MGHLEQHVVVSAGGHLWQATSTTGLATISAWEQIAPDAASAPDCLVTRDGRLHVVVLTAAGTVIDVLGKTGGPWAATELNGY